MRSSNSKELSKFRYGLSLAASWAWGTSLIVGMELIQTKGLLPFIIWATANSLALPLFGLLSLRIKNLKEIISSKIVGVFTTIVSVFCLWIQMNAVFEQLKIIISNSYDVQIKIAIILIFIILSFLLFKDGIIKSVKIDSPIWSICYLLLVISLVIGISNRDYNNIIYYSHPSDFKWAINSCFILFSGPFMCIQNWQVVEILEKEGKMSSHYFAGILFAIYMVFVGCLGCINLDKKLKIVLVAVIIIIAFSTADSAIVGMQELFGKKFGVGLSVTSCLMWPFVSSIGVMGLWSTMGNMRKYVVLICIIISLILTKRKNKNEK